VGIGPGAKASGWGLAYARSMNTGIGVSGVDFVTVFVDDYSAALPFYRDVLGLEHSVDYERIPGGEFETGSLTLQVIEAASIGIDFVTSGHPIALHVPDVAAARATLEGAGVSFGAETIDSGVCLMAHFRDPAGNALMLHNRYAPKS
jgi:predicted enzyme related to lactoylglutathione lyase